MLSIISVLQTKTNKLQWGHPLVFDEANSNGVLWDGDLDDALHELGLEIQEDGESPTTGQIYLLTRKFLDAKTEFVTFYKKGEDGYIDFSNAQLYLSEWIKGMGYNALKFDMVEANHLDKKLALEQSEVELSDWVYILFEKDSKRLHILGVDKLGSVIYEIQVPDNSIVNDSIDDNKFQDWLNDAKNNGILIKFE